MIAGLKKHVAHETLRGRLVCCIANLKAAKLAGLASEAMILAAVQPNADGSELVIPLTPPGMLGHTQCFAGREQQG